MKPDHEPSLGAAERRLFILMSELSAIRNQLMHRTAPEQIDVSIAAMSIIGLLKYIEQFRGVSASNIVWQSPPIETSVVSAIRYTRHAEYGDFMAVFLREKHGGEWLGLCPACAVRGVVASTCEACFTELGTVDCPNCQETAYYDLREYSHSGSAAAECECGMIVPV